jgi:hypothetical protein
VHEQLQVEFSAPDSFIEQATNVNGRLVFTEACRRWAERDPETMRLVTQALSAGTDALEAESWVWPRADVEFSLVTAVQRDNGAVSSEPSGGIIFRYDFKKLLFHADAAAVSTAERDICLQRARLAIDAAIVRFENLVIDWCELQKAAGLEERRHAELVRLMQAVHSLDELGVLTAGSFDEWKHREQVALREQSETARQLAGVRQSLQTELGLVAEAEPDLGNVEALLTVPVIPEGLPGGPDIQRWLPGVWQSHPATRVAELELFAAEMQEIAAKRERLPHLTGAIGLGDLDTWVGANSVAAEGNAEVGVTMPLFDAGTIGRGIQQAGLRRNLARRNVQTLARSLTRDVQASLAALRAAQDQAEHHQAECEEVRRLAEVARRGSAFGQGDPLLPFALRVYQVEAERGALEANMKLAKAWLAYQEALGEQPVPHLSADILDGLVRDLEKTQGK